jgi:Flp pilus assembly protein TadD
MDLEQKGDINGAVTEFRKAVESKPDDPKAHAALAGALELRGDSASALREYGLALKLDPNDPAVRANYDRLVQTANGDRSGAGS